MYTGLWLFYYLMSLRTVFSRLYEQMMKFNNSVLNFGQCGENIEHSVFWWP